MKEITIIAYPYATQTGSLMIPDNLNEQEARQYISDNWDNIQFNEPELDYCGTDFDFDLDE